MKALSLDYRVEHSWLTRGGWVVLFLTCASLAQMVWHYSDLIAQSRDRQAQLDALTDRFAPRGHGHHSIADVHSAADIRVAQEVLLRLDQPWDRLFAAVEMAAGDDVALLGIKPDPAKGLVRITGEAKQYDDVLAYARRLEASHVLSDVYLLSHEIQTRDPEQPIRFTVGAAWRDGS